MPPKGQTPFSAVTFYSRIPPFSAWNSPATRTLQQERGEDRELRYGKKKRCELRTLLIVKADFWKVLGIFLRCLPWIMREKNGRRKLAPHLICSSNIPRWARDHGGEQGWANASQTEIEAAGWWR